MRGWLAIYLKGICMGAADIVPGVSGGTIALIVGIYDRLVSAIASLDPRALRHLARVHEPAARQAFRAELVEMDVPFLFALGLGVVTAVLVLSRIIHAVFEAYPAYVNAFFFGLIAVSAVLIYRDAAVDTLARAAVALVGFALAFTVSGLAAGESSGSLPVVFVAGAIAISAMILPGISGAAFLYILGQYEFMLDALTRTVDGVLALELTAETFEAGLVVAAFLAGAAIGILTVAHLVAWALSTYRVATLVFLVSLMVGALRLPLEQVYAELGTPGPVPALGLAVAAGIGVAAVLALDRATGSLEYA